MKVAFNARILWGPQMRGWSRYTSNLIRSLSHLDIELILVTDRSLNSSLLSGANQSNIEIIQKKGRFYLDWEQRVLPAVCQALNVDILHSPINYGLPLRSSCPQVLTLHDVIDDVYFKHHLPLRKKYSIRSLYNVALHKASILASDKIITVSEYSKKDIVKFKGVPSDKVEVIYGGSDQVFNQKNITSLSDLQKRWGIQKNYFFYVGGFEERKNVNFLFESFAQLEEDVLLVIAGGGVEKSGLRQLAQKYGIEERVKFLGWVEDADLPSLYSYALAFVYPSLYEGFGLQLVEAMAVGGAVLCSNVTSLPEVWGNKEGLFDPTDRNTLLNEMKAVIRNPEYRESLKEWSRQRSSHFSWEKAALETYKVYQSLV